MVRHPWTGAALPRLIRFEDPKIQEMVNHQLDTFASELSCAEEGEKPTTQELFDVKSKVTYAGDDVLSVDVRASFFCGAYPTDANFSVTYDLRTGAEVPFEALFSNYQRDGAEIARALYPEHVARAESFAASGQEESESGSCDDHPEAYAVESLLETGFAYALSPRGLIVEPNFPHVSAACAEQVTVLFERIRRFAAPGGVLARVTDASAGN
jgi:hypothetical protein